MDEKEKKNLGGSGGKFRNAMKKNRAQVVFPIQVPGAKR